MLTYDFLKKNFRRIPAASFIRTNEQSICETGRSVSCDADWESPRPPLLFTYFLFLIFVGLSGF